MRNLAQVICNLGLDAHVRMWNICKVMSPTEMKNLSAQTVQEFVSRVEGARLVTSPVVRIKGIKGRLRVKRATSMANQIQVGRGEPLVIHIPGKDGESSRWYVVGVRWQLNYARTHAKTAAQHASHAFDCMAIRASELETIGATLLVTDDADLRTKCVQALDESRDRTLRTVITAINVTRDAVADALIDTLQRGLFDIDDDDDDDDE